MTLSSHLKPPTFSFPGNVGSPPPRAAGKNTGETACAVSSTGHGPLKVKESKWSYLCSFHKHHYEKTAAQVFLNCKSGHFTFLLQTLYTAPHKINYTRLVTAHLSPCFLPSPLSSSHTKPLASAKSSAVRRPVFSARNMHPTWEIPTPLQTTLRNCCWPFSSPPVVTVF